MAALLGIFVLFICIGASVAGTASPVFEGVWTSTRSSTPNNNAVAENALDGIPNTWAEVPASTFGCYLEVAVSPAYVTSITVYTATAAFPSVRVVTKPSSFSANDFATVQSEADVSQPESTGPVVTTATGFIPFGYVTYQINRPVSRIRIYAVDTSIGLVISDVFLNVAEPVQLLNPTPSSFTGFATVFPASNSIDKSLLTFAHSGGDSEPKLYYNFAPSSVSKIVIWNRNDCCKERLNPFYVLLKNGPFTATSTSGLLAEATWSAYSASPNQVVYSFSVNTAAHVTHLVIIQNNAIYLNIAEVVIFPTLVSAQMSPMQLSRAAITSPSLSSNYPSVSYPVSLAFDGNVNTFAHTDINYDQFIQGSFTQAKVTSVVIVNRADCCQNRIDPFYVFLKDGAFVGSGINQLLSETGVTNYQIAGIFSSYVLKVNKVTATNIRIVGASWNYQHFAEIIVYRDVVLNPQITQVTPNAVNYNGGLRITVTGSGFSYAASDMDILVSTAPNTLNGGVGIPYRYSCTDIQMIEPYSKFSCVAPRAYEQGSSVGMWPTTKGPQGSNNPLFFIPGLFRYTREPVIDFIEPSLWVRNSATISVRIQGTELGTSTAGMTATFTSNDGTQSVQCTGFSFAVNNVRVSCNMGGLSVQGFYSLTFTSTSSPHVTPLTLTKPNCLIVMP